jgi:hypothetical protein
MNVPHGRWMRLDEGRNAGSIVTRSFAPSPFRTVIS